MNSGLFSVAMTVSMAFGAAVAADVSAWVNPLIGDLRILPLTDSTRSTCSTQFNIDPLKNFPQRATSRRLSCHGIMCGAGG